MGACVFENVDVLLYFCLVMIYSMALSAGVPLRIK
jgi:hypothetical protein